MFDEKHTPVKHHNHPDEHLIANIMHLAQQAHAHIFTSRVPSPMPSPI